MTEREIVNLEKQLEIVLRRFVKLKVHNFSDIS